jgi:hypothetical protein
MEDNEKTTIVKHAEVGMSIPPELVGKIAYAKTPVTLPYLDEYNKFIKDYQTAQVSGEEIGEVIARMAQYFSEYNLKLVKAERCLYLVGRDIANRVDEATGKAIAVSKAELLISATDEHLGAEEAKAHVQNIEQFINALKALQKGVLNEYSHQSLT